ncbi:MAG: molybdopterin biosynthesis protein [Candidatus Bathyarchaeota archaeon]
MKQKVFRELLSVPEAKRRLTEHFVPQPVGGETLPLESCFGRVLSSDIEASIDVPPFDRASMDGFAVHAEDTFGAEEDQPISLKVVGQIGAGENPRVALENGEAAEISTGAPIPQGANAVVMVEYTWQDDDSLRVYRAVSPGENIMAAGSDIMAGELILRKGDFLTPRETGVLSAIGVTKVDVFRKPLVAVISTGNEVISPGAFLEYGKIYDINSRSIADSVLECGGVPSFLGIAGDEKSAIRSKIEEGFRKSDIVILSGGTSAGVGDLVYRIIDELGKPGILVHGVSVKPGKPLIIAVVNGKPLFGLPGYPTSALMMFNVFVRPVLREMAGLKAEAERMMVEAKTAEKIESSLGRYQYLPVNLVQTESGTYHVYPVPGESGAITTLAEADGFIEVSGDRAFLSEGEDVLVELFSPELKPADLLIIGSHCVGIDLLLRLMRQKKTGFRSKVINTGSSGGMVAIRRGQADIAGTHLLDEKSGEYNIPFLDRYEITEKAVLVRGYVREQGLIVAHGNPKNIQSLEDLVDQGLSVMNRNPGSGTRILLDMLLREAAKKRGISLSQLISGIKGYQAEAKSHSAVAVAVLQGKADVGLAIRAVAELYGLDFIPIAAEQYDFLIQKSSLLKPAVKSFLEVLKSKEFKGELKQRLPGLSPTEDTGTVIFPKDFEQ